VADPDATGTRAAHARTAGAPGASQSATVSGSLPGSLDLADPHAGWRSVTAAFTVASFIETVGWGHFFAFLPILVRDLGVLEAEAATVVGLLSSAALLAGLPLVPFWGAWADRYSRKLIIVRSAVFEAILFFFLGIAGEVWQLFLLVPLAGLVLGNTGVMLAEITDRAPRARLGLAISLVGTAGPLGFAIGPAAGGIIADGFGVQVLFIVDALLTVGVVAILLLFHHERADRPRSGLPVMTLVRRSLVAVVRTPLARAVFTAYFFVLLGQRMFSPFLALWVEALQGPRMLATVVGLIAGAYGLAAAIGAPLAGSAGDRVGYKRVLVVAIGLIVASTVVAGLAEGIAGFSASYAVLGVGFATASSMLFTILATGLPPEVRSAVLNLALVPLYLAGILGSLLATQVLVATGGELRILWFLAGMLVALAWVPALRLQGPIVSERP
jgi:MFS family permease